MKTFYKVLPLALTLCCATSCANFLDIVPDETVSEKDSYADRQSADRYLYSCYAYLPNSATTSSSLDLLTGDEVISSFEHETFSAFPKGNYTPSNPVISYWNNLFQGIRQCYLFQQNIDKFPEITDEQRRDYFAQSEFLLGYYHFLLARCYGSIIIVDGLYDVNMKVSDFPGRQPYDACVEWICNKFDKAAETLPASRDEFRRQYGFATSVAAKAFKAKMLLYAASPLFNSDRYADFTDPKGVKLMPQGYDAQKWVKAKDALKEAIDLAEANGIALYERNDYPSDNPFPAAGVERRLRMGILDWQDKANPEVIFAETRGVGIYDLQSKSAPLGAVDGAGYNGVAPTWAMLNRFYTKNGLPWDEDPEFKNLNKLEVVTIDQEHADQARPDKQTIKFNLDREPRFYAWIAFQGGYYEILNADPNNRAYPTNYMPENGRVVLDFLKNGNQGRKERNNNYSPTGYLTKKATYPDHKMRKMGSGQQVKDHPWPVLRLADLYLAYAEACVETGALDEAKRYLNKVRTRAGIPTVEESWAKAGVTLDQAKLRDVVRQERMIELFLENQNFWDMRRWGLAEQYFSKKAQGLNIQATTMEDFAKLTEVPFERKFTATNYLLPIPIADINRNPNLNNNPGY